MRSMSSSSCRLTAMRMARLFINVNSCAYVPYELSETDGIACFRWQSPRDASCPVSAPAANAQAGWAAMLKFV